MGKESPDILICGKLVTHSSDGELAMAQLEHESSIERDTDRSLGNSDGSSSNRSWDVCHVNVTKSNNKIACYLALIYVGKIKK